MGVEENKESAPGALPPNEEADNPSSEAPASGVAPEAEMGRGSAQSASSKPSWFTPKRLLAMFCIINMLNYIERGALASNGVNGNRRTCTDSGVCSGGSGIQGDFNLNNFEDGVLSSAFMVGLVVASPIFASLAKTHNPFRLIGVGLLIWTLAVAGCGFSFGFWSIAICRMLVGIGEASFISLASPFIDDNAPESQKTFWLALFYMCIPTGIAVGYVFGGLVGGHLSWRYAFWVEAILMLPFVILGFVIKPLKLKGFASSAPKIVLEPVDTDVAEVRDADTPKNTADGGRKESGDKVSKKNLIVNSVKNFRDQVPRFWKDVKVLLLDRVYVVNVLGYIAYNFVIGAYSYWGPKAGYNIYHMTNADMMFGGVTVVCGIIGTLAGGYILDVIGSTITNAFKLLSAAALLGAIFCFSAFCSKNLYIFLALFSLGELSVFITQAPVNFVCLHCVKPGLRALSMALSTDAIHVLGDVPSSPLVGVLQDYLNDWRKTALILTSILFIAAGIWFSGIFLHSVDRFNEEDENSTVPVERSNTTPLLDGNTTQGSEPV
ncbi:hypothetical protein H6P81_020054 [Aristolochia fimbriata]|uniref:Major facilitator superfamily (MFS) profile domain-containing protein n=1 Tax=Aristolochia fimbriata TaxID=158543 RepID=A0AAV7DUE9_ARIFI|nr:hypothetical protein H6P81_020054 [Aristolochia fimbriata]